ncbi:putative membrane protein [Gottschalkia acidurici 9a]|uniref:Membrane protein n=1 Tax=Gottschalkia acidurici (strain ATCC 7906 / DSM 604 / BCRC 14475 / CIP 104303 / KCTC 5404 / NCIMB 10678 / 9a) TaxID=1128398 RepID=K0B0E3_GOTA9|nr:hypothetical protein [Gottschalkia acidurici]AFS78532.1 putative membrane protein [Gottschalkia acidurici 9a]
MFLNIYNLKLLVCISIISIIIKIIDNVVDNEGYVDESKLLPEKGILPYVVIMMGVASMLNINITVSLIFSAYIVGMFENLNMTFLFSLKGYQESIIVAILGILFIGFNDMISSILVISSIQLIDDLIDMDKDRITQNKNYALKYGIVEVSIATIILFLIALFMSPNKTIISFLVFGVFQFIENFIIWRSLNGTRNS